MVVLCKLYNYVSYGAIDTLCSLFDCDAKV